MKGIPTLGFKRLKRAAVLAGVGALIVGGSVLGASQAQALAIFGTTPGALTLTPASGPSTTVPTYNSTACPNGFAGAATPLFIDPKTTAGTPVNQINDDALAGTNLSVASAFSGTFQFPIGNVVSDLGLSTTTSTTVEFVNFCYTAANGTGPGEFVQDTFVTFNPVAGTYSSSATPPAGPASTSVALTASTPDYAGQPITLTATITANPTTNGTPAGTVAFNAGGTLITGCGTQPVTNGVATCTTSSFLAGANQAISAAYTSSDTTKWNSSTGNATLTVVTAPAFGGNIPLAVTVPTSGAFSLTVDTTDVVTLTAAGLTATGTTTPVVVSDTRNSYPGWSVSGQANPWTGTTGGTAAGGTIAANQLGWVPGTVPAGVTAGPTVAPATTFGSTASVLALAHAGLNGGVNGYGTFNLTAALNLVIPATAPAGPYTSTLSITGVSSQA
jgi:hypothetical protein